jgi:ParB-like chromosome segregation protein Spo0J
MAADPGGAQAMRNSYAIVDPKSLRPGGYNPNALNDDQRAQLVDEIKHQGRLLKPVVCRDDAGQLVIIDGEHNWQAALEAGLTEVRVEAVEVDDFEARPADRHI